MGRFIKLTLLMYILYAAVMYAYIFHLGDAVIPAQYKGTSADPAMFMDERQLLLSEEYSEIRNYLFFLEAPLGWIFFFFLLGLGISSKLEGASLGSASRPFLQRSIYFFYISILSYAFYFPLNYISYHLSGKYGISTQSFSQWMRDDVIDFWVNYGTSLLMVLVLCHLMSKYAKHWWLYLWFASIPFILFFMFVKPVVIDPLYNDFYPLKNKQLETKILSMAEEAGIPADHVYEVNMAEKTNAMNAYVTGIGSNSRIVLWDTTMNKLGEQEILFIMAHEMAHYVEKHIYFGIALYLIFGFVGLWMTSKIMNYVISRWGEALRIPSINSLSAIPLFLCTISILSFAASPISNAVSRYEENRADEYAIAAVGDKEAAIKTFQELSKSSLSQVNPPLMVKLFRYSHPTMLERINHIDTFEPEDDDD